MADAERDDDASEVPAPAPTGAKRIVGARYELEAKLGRGGMGVVYRARDLRLERRVALKLLPEAAVGNPVARARLLREAKVAAAFQHPNVAHVYDVGQTADGGAYLAMELVQGRTWRQEVASERSTGDRLRLLREALLAVGAAHAAGLVHRDIKPENLMVRDDGRLVLLDFGLAKLVSPEGPSATITAGTSMVGTPRYMSPEQHRGRPVGPAADQFSLAVTGYELLTRRLPWKGEATQEYLAAMLLDPHTPPSTYGLPAALDPVFARALAREPEDRYPSVEDLAAALEEATAELPAETLDGLPPDASVKQTRAAPSSASAGTTAPAPEGERPPMPRALLVLTLALFALTGVGLGVWRARQAEAPSSQPSSSQSAGVGASLAGLTATSGVLACPVLEGREGATRAGWLGAAAAHAACRRATYLLGGRYARTLVPAELLELPTRPTDDFPADVYDAVDARARSVSAARRRAQAYLDGTVTAHEDRVELTLTVNSPDGRAQADVTVTSVTLHAAIERAIMELAQKGALPRVAVLEPEVATWLGTDDPEVAMAAEDLYRVTSEGLVGELSCVPLRAHAPPVAPLAPLVEQLCDGKPVALTPFDDARAAPSALARRAVLEYRVNPLPAEVLKSRLARLREHASGAQDTLDRAMLTEAQAWVKTRLDGYPSSHAIFLEAIRIEPRLARLWGPMVTSTLGTPSFGATTRAAQAWSPDSSYVWSASGAGLKSLTYLRRSARLGLSASTALTLAQGLLAEQKREELDALAVGLAKRPPDGDTVLAALVGVMVELGDARLGEAYAHASATLSARRGDDADVVFRSRFALWELTFALALVLDKATPLAEALAAQIGAEPPRAPGDGGPGRAPMSFASWCALASPAVAKRCLADVRALLDASFFLAPLPGTREALACAEASLSLPAKGAAEACRPTLAVARTHPGRFVFLAMLLDRAGLPEVADEVDPIPKQPGELGLVTSAHVRGARRAAARGDRARARELAKQVVDAWALADVKVPVVDEMRALMK